MPKSEGWSNVAHHCLVEGAAAETMVQVLELPEEDKDIIIQTALLHDFYKRKSVELIRVDESNALNADIISEEQSQAILRKKGFDEKIISCLNNSIGSHVLEDGYADKMTIPEKIIHYLDDITMDDDLVSLKERTENLKKRYPTINKDGIKLFGKPYYDRQYEVGAAIEIELAALVGLDKPENLPKYLKEKILDKINNVKI